MPMNAYAQKMVAAADSQDGIVKASAGTFRSLVRAAGRQIRPPFMARHAAAKAVEMLGDLWNDVAVRQGDAIHVSGAIDGSQATIVTVMRDQPFIVDTVRLALKESGASYAGGFNVVVGMQRDGSGKIERVDAEGDQLESIVLMEADGLDAQSLETLLTDLRGRLRLTQAAVADFQEMTDLLDSSAYKLGRYADRAPDRGVLFRETGELLRWLLSDNFVFMGIVCGDRRLGVAKETVANVWSTERLFDGWSEEALIEVRKGAADSPMHRAGRVDELRVRIPSIGVEDRFLYIQGLFTYRAITQPSRHVPQLRRMLARVLRDQDSKPGSYRYKGIANVFDSLPTEFLFSSSREQVVALIERVLEAEQEHEARTHLTQPPSGTTAFVLAAMPRERWSDDLRKRMQADIIAATGATWCDHGVFVGRYQTMLVHFFVTGTHALDDAAQAALHQRLGELATPWQDRVYAELHSVHGEDRAGELLLRYGNAFDRLYTQVNTPARTVADIEMLERLPRDHGVEVALFRDEKGRVKLRIYQAEDIILSTILPVLDDFGLVVIDQFADDVRPLGVPARTIDTFRLRGVWAVDEDDLLERGHLLVDALRAVFDEKIPVDPLNRILLRASVPWQAVDLLRAYNGYARQLGLRYTLNRVQEILLGRPTLVQKLWAWFQARFDPDLEGDRAVLTKATREACEEGLLQITDHDQDRVFQTFFNLMDATLRTNFYRDDRPGHYISLKLDAAAIKMMTGPRLRYEIYVHHREMEGVHLRGGAIARGGIRWSDREDYRREIFDLASTQMVKNVLIVPEGAKGGFYIKNAGGTYSERRARADRLYQVLVRGMLDVTDNIAPDGSITYPPRVVRRDGDDPYIVVAADKGTAHLSDTANGISQSYEFWLDDAFASGGSNGYDHKKVGITARGAWMTARRAFQEMGLDPHNDEFTAIAIGDPSGDVFGNGVIEHPTMKLVAAFNHLHIFIDPDPDPESSFAERKRLFDANQDWSHYDTSKLSKGGGIFSRQARAIELTPEIKQFLGVIKDELPVDVVLRLILRLDVDLWWNGGIGTYVKASHQSQADAGDPSNDDIRVNATELRAKVVAEGGNLGFTPAARTEFALGGGRIHTDFIDNSGGVDMSDHEVNLKILLNPMVARGTLSLEDRNTLLESLTDEVADDVLANSDRHARQLSLDIVRATRDPLTFSGPIDWVCSKGETTRATLALPSNDVLQRRAAANQGVARPELAILQAHVKMHVFKELNASDPARIPGFGDKVVGYFPERIGERFPDDIAAHMLHRDIGMTVVVNEVVGHSGAAFFPMVSELTGRSMVDIARAWYRAMDLVDAWTLHDALTAANLPIDVLNRAWVQVTDAVFGLVTQWLAPGEAGPDHEPADTIRKALTTIADTRGSELDARLEARTERYSGTALPLELSARIGLLGELTAAREVALLASADEPLADTVVRYYSLGEASRLLPVIRSLSERKAEGGWDPVAIGILRTRYRNLLRELERTVDVRREVRLGIDRVATRLGRGQLKPLRELMARLLGRNPTVSALLVAEERVRAWISGIDE